MDTIQSERLFLIKHFPPVIHPRHARELLVGKNDEALREWVGGYSITILEHRQMLEEILSSLAWKEHGYASLVQGLYGTGKSHLLVLLHLLAALPESWPHFLNNHPIFRRYMLAMQNHRRLVIHFSLDEYAPKHPLEQTLKHEIERALAQSDISIPTAWKDALSRLDAWTALLECCREHGYDGIILLIDELSLFLAGKSPAMREADACFLQFLADLTTRFPIWLFGALQRNLSDVGTLSTHSWRQVEDRFRHYTLSPQAIGNMLREKFIQRLDLPAIRSLVSKEIAPAADLFNITVSASDLQLHWPFHPAAIDLLVEITNNHLSPHRGMVEILQQLEHTDCLKRPANRLITPLDLFSLVRDDLCQDARLDNLWKAVALLENSAANAPDVLLTSALIDLLAIIHLADHSASVHQLHGLLFDGISAPNIEDISQALHFLRRRGAYLSVIRDNKPENEIFSLAIGDEIGAMALARMQEIRLDVLAGDSRIVETVIQRCRDEAWPFNAALQGGTIPVQWFGERSVNLQFVLSILPEEAARIYEGLLAGNADACVLLEQPGIPVEDKSWKAAAEIIEMPYSAVFLRWRPRELTEAESELWREYACWQLSANSLASGTTHDSKIARRCQEHADELLSAVEFSLRTVYGEGDFLTAAGTCGESPNCSSLGESIMQMLSHGFENLFPIAAEMSANGIPSPAACQQLLHHFFMPGEIQLISQSLIGDYIERFAVPLGCVEIIGQTARVVAPRHEIIDILLQATQKAPIRISEALSILQRPPLGLTPEQGRIATAAALHCGIVQGLDSFLQTIDIHELPVPFTDAVVFLGPPSLLEDKYRPVISQIAEYWQIPLDSWAFACNQVERRLCDWNNAWQEKLPSIRSALDEWSEALHVLPWGWQGSFKILEMHDELSGLESTSLNHILEYIEKSGVGLFKEMDSLGEAVHWWNERKSQIGLLLSMHDFEGKLGEIELMRSQLSVGEESFPSLPQIGVLIDSLIERFSELYRGWHNELFGAQVVEALRMTFDHPKFRAVKALSRLPLPLPESACSCLESLAQARNNYCPASLAQLHIDGCCSRCRLLLGSPSPMPNTDLILPLASRALSEYEELLSTHPWAETVRRQLPRAPESISKQGNALLNWKADDGAQQIIELIDDRLIDWLTRDQRVVGVRRINDVRKRLQGRDMTKHEVEETVKEWLDPEQALTENALLSFE